MKQKSKVILYGTESCIWCHRTREFFKEQGIKFKDIDVGSDQKAAQEMIRKSGQIGVPVIDINGEVIVGFDEPSLRKVLHLKPRH